MSFFEPDYDIVNKIPHPKKGLGLKRGGLDDYVSEAREIAAYYGDAIVFGSSSTSTTKNYRPDGKFVRKYGKQYQIQTYGVNYFVPTGITCHNGAQMYKYVETIPRGDGMGKNVQRAMASVGLPPLRGLAPGALEDMKEAGNVKEIANAFFGSVYPVCSKLTLFVGTADGKITNEKGNALITEPETAQNINGANFQTRWVQALNQRGDPITLSKEEFEKIPKSLKFDGNPVDSDPKPAEKSNLLSVPPNKNSWNSTDLKEKFTTTSNNTALFIAAAIPLLVLSAIKLLKQ